MKREKKSVSKIEFILIILAVAVLLVILGSRDNIKKEGQIQSPTPTQNPTATQKPTKSEINDSLFKDAYMEGCLSEGEGNYLYCDCTYRYMRDKLGMTGFIKVSEEYNETGEMPDVVYEAVAKCVGEQQGVKQIWQQK